MGWDLHDVTVRLPVQFESAAAMAGFVNSVMDEAMARKGWSGGCAVLFRKNDDDAIVMFHEGLHEPYEGKLPHGLVEPVLDRCSPANPCPAINEDHITAFGECFVQSYERIVSLGSPAPEGVIVHAG